ncbi:hypothetical protein GF358_00660 [Candidatus Woesearchaeota archaeon]|nr:hypothetical protein [Candidatus Woesearchaeota archaeon]
MKKRGQKAIPGSAAGALIGLITLLIIFYIILIPPAEREKLLDDAAYITPEGGEVLFSEYIGRLSASPDEDAKHLIPNMHLKEITEATTLAYENSFMIKKGLTEQYKTIDFFIEDPEHTNNVMVSFNTPTHTGTLKILCNGYTIFEGDVNTESPMPVKINKNYLEKENKLTLEVHGFGVPAKVYSFENFRIIGDVTNVKKQEASHLISVTDEEYDNFKSGYLDYMPICNQATVGALEVILNGQEINSGIPNCNSLARIQLDKTNLKRGRNEITFRLISGTINIEQARIRTFLKSKTAWSRYFYISTEQYDLIQNNDAILEIEFADDGYSKKAQMTLNGELQMIKQQEPYFARDISSIIKQGNNHISIKPETNLNIMEIEVRIE